MKKNILLILFAILAFALALIITNPNFKDFRNRLINLEKIGISKNRNDEKNTYISALRYRLNSL